MRDQLILDFFDTDKPCPEQIPFCTALRQKYQEELNKLNQSGCSACKKNSLKAQFMKEVWERYLIANTK